MRELVEELGMNVDVKEHFMTVHHNYDSFGLELISYICEFKSATYQLIDHDQFEWFATSNLMNYVLAPADVPIADAISDKANII